MNACTICTGTGKRPGSDDLNCRCSNADERAELNQAIADFAMAYDGEAFRADRAWFIHQRARGIEHKHIADLMRDWKTGVMSAQDVVVELFARHSSTPALPVTRDDVMFAAERAVSLASKARMVLTVRQIPELPLAMGNYFTRVEVRPARERAEVANG